MAFINRPPYEGGSWHHHFALGYLLADTGLYCSLIVTNQTAYAIYKYAPQFKEALEALLSGRAWGATWMSETQGGSDLGANRTTARPDGDGWRLDGEDKYFASNAGLADWAIVTARPQGAPSGPKGIALFLVPRLDEQDGLNFHVRRLKRKSATRAVPTGEVEFHGSRAFLIGEAALGIYYTLENLTVSRLANAAGAMGLARKAHLEALLRVRARSAFGKALVEHPLVRYDLTDLAVRTAGGLALAFHAIQAFDKAWLEKPPYSPAYHYARFLSHLAKNRTAEHAAFATQLAMELFGGLGFMEDYAISRLHRESLVTADLGGLQQYSGPGHAGGHAQEARPRILPGRVHPAPGAGRDAGRSPGAPAPGIQPGPPGSPAAAGRPMVQQRRLAHPGGRGPGRLAVRPGRAGRRTLRPAGRALRRALPAGEARTRIGRWTSLRSGSRSRLLDNRTQVLI